MKQFVISLAVIALVVQTAQAGHLGLGGWGGPGLGGRHGGFGHGDDVGLDGLGGIGRFDAERLQTRFENKFEDLQEDYDTGLADVEDFYNSDEYTEVVDGVERLTDRYDLFLSSVERSIDRLADVITIATDDLTFYADLLAEYQAREDLSEERLARIETRLTNIQDHLTDKIDLLTEKQTTLTDNFGSYQTFSSDLTAYLTEILAAGGGTTEVDETTAGLLSSVAALAATAGTSTLGEESSFCETPQTALEATGIPEPNAWMLLAVATSVLALRRPAREHSIN